MILSAKTLKNILAFAFAVGFLCPSAKAVTEAESGDSDYRLFAGFPVCTEVIARWSQEQVNLFREKLPKSERAKADSLNLDVHPPVDVLQRNQPSAFERPHDFYFHRIQPMHGGDGGCFAKETVVLTLDGAARDHMLQTTKVPWEIGEAGDPREKFAVGTAFIEDIYKDYLVLSSTLAVLPDPRYHRDCWARAEGHSSGIIYQWKGEKFAVLEVEMSNGAKPFTLKARTIHRFYVNPTFQDPSDPSTWGWLRAGGLQRGMHLYPGEAAAGAAVKSRRSTVPPKPGSWGAWANKHRGGTSVYNLFVPDTFTYYVGPSLDQRVLVHNVK
ncbi:MAG: hypothetical protein V1798_03585 [Pseudomonadota bacterium]